MKKYPLIWQGLIHALGIIAYVSLVALLMNNAKYIFEEKPGLIGFISFLLLFVLSAAIVGFLILGQPLMKYLDGEKKEAIKMFLYTVGWLFVSLVIILVTLAILKI